MTVFRTAAKERHDVRRSRYDQWRKRTAELLILCVAATGPANAACSDTDTHYWQGERRLAIYDRLMPLMSCRDYGSDEQALADQSACNWFVGRGLQAAFNINDFTPQAGGWKNANQIASHVAQSDQWAYLGEARDQSVLDSAASAAGEGAAVLAVKPGSPHGHVALVLAGTPTGSGGWNLRVPNSASMLLGRPSDSYVGCKLSYAFQSPEGVKLYRRR